MRIRQISNVAGQEKRQQNRRRKDTQIEAGQTILLCQRTTARLVGVLPLVEKAANDNIAAQIFRVMKFL